MMSCVRSSSDDVTHLFVCVFSKQYLRGDLYKQLKNVDSRFLKDNHVDPEDWRKKASTYTVRDAALYGTGLDRPSTRATTYILTTPRYIHVVLQIDTTCNVSNT